MVSTRYSLHGKQEVIVFSFFFLFTVVGVVSPYMGNKNSRLTRHRETELLIVLIPQKKNDHKVKTEECKPGNPDHQWEAIR